MVNGRTVGAVGLALVMMVGGGSSLTLAQSAKKKAVTKAAAGPAPTAEEVASAEEAYTLKCAVCHTPTGESPIPNMNFADGQWLHGSSVKEVVKTIADGVQGTAMMPFKTQFTEGELVALARKVRSFDKKLK